MGHDDIEMLHVYFCYLHFKKGWSLLKLIVYACDLDLSEIKETQQSRKRLETELERSVCDSLISPIQSIIQSVESTVQSTVQVLHLPIDDVI